MTAQQLVTLIKAGLKHRGFAVIDVISPCVTFNDHEGSTKSYEFTRKHSMTAIYTDFVPPAKEIRAEYEAGKAMPVQMHDGSQIVLRKADGAYDPTDRVAAFEYIQRTRRPARSLPACCTSTRPSRTCTSWPTRRRVRWRALPFSKVCPGNKTLAVDPEPLSLTE